MQNMYEKKNSFSQTFYLAYFLTLTSMQLDAFLGATFPSSQAHELSVRSKIHVSIENTKTKANSS